MLIRIGLFLSMVLLTCNLSQGAEQPTQQDLLINLVEGLNWSFGLPDTPGPDAYLAIVNGRRTLRIEAEEHRADSDQVSVKNYTNFGPFSGTGWVSGIHLPTQLHLNFLVPISGRYQVSAALRLPDHSVEIGGQLLAGDGTDRFERIRLGEVDLTAGPQVAVIELPPNGAIDYLDLTAPPLPSITPLNGWQLDAPLTTAVLAEVALQIIDAELLLPENGPPFQIEAENASDVAPSNVVKFQHLGAPSGGVWIRAGIDSIDLELPFELAEPRVMRFLLRGTGDHVTLQIDDDPAGTVDFPPYLENKPGPVKHLAAGKHRIAITLPPGSGLDLVELQTLDSSPATILELAGMDPVNRPAGLAELDKIIALLATVTPPR